MTGVEPVGLGRQGNPIYRIRDAAPLLTKFEVTPEMIDERMRRMNPQDLPPVLQKMFWEGLAVRERYKELAGELWSTADVSLVAAQTFQSLRMSLLLIPDALMNDTDLTERQMKIVQAIIDTALEEARANLVSELRKPSGQRSTPDIDEDEL